MRANMRTQLSSVKPDIKDSSKNRNKSPKSFVLKNIIIFHKNMVFMLKCNKKIWDLLCLLNLRSHIFDIF